MMKLAGKAKCPIMRQLGMDKTHELLPEQVLNFTAKELLAIPAFGKISLVNVEKWLAFHGMKLRDDRQICPHCGKPI